MTSVHKVGSGLYSFILATVLDNDVILLYVYDCLLILIILTVLISDAGR